MHLAAFFRPQLIKRRGKSGLLKLNATFEEASEFIRQKQGTSLQVQVRMLIVGENSCVQIEQVTGLLDTFLIEKFVPHAGSDEMYLCIQVRAGLCIFGSFPTQYQLLCLRYLVCSVNATVMKFSSIM